MGTSGSAPGEPYRARSSVWLAGGTWVLLAGLGAGQVYERGADAAGTLSILLVLGYLAWCCFGHPTVAVQGHGVRIVNPLRTIDVPWEALIDIRVRTALTLVTPHGTYTAWAVPGTGQRPREDTPTDDEGYAAVIRRHWAALVEDGLIEGGEADTTPVSVMWDRAALAVLGALLALVVVSHVL